MKHPARSFPALVFGIAALILVLGLAACSGDDEQSATTTTRPKGENTEALRAFLEKAAGGKTAVFAATYDVELPGTAIPGGVLELAQDGDRRMSELAGGPGEPAVGFYDSGGGTIACAATHSGADWQCYRTTGDASTAPLVIDREELFRIMDQLRSVQYWYSFATTDEVVAGVAATCLTAEALPGIPDETKARVAQTAHLCVSESGAPLVVDLRGGDSTIVVNATSYRSEVADEDFTPPAPVQEGPPNVLVPAPPEEVPSGQAVE